MHGIHFLRAGEFDRAPSGRFSSFASWPRSLLLFFKVALSFFLTIKIVPPFLLFVVPQRSPLKNSKESPFPCFLQGIKMSAQVRSRPLFFCKLNSRKNKVAMGQCRVAVAVVMRGHEGACQWEPCHAQRRLCYMGKHGSLVSATVCKGGFGQKQAWTLMDLAL